MTDPKKDQTALVTAREAALALADAPQFNAYVADMQQRAHVLSPVSKIGSLPMMWKIVPTVVHLNPDPAAGEVYRDPLFCSEGEVAITKVGLRRIAQAAALSTRIVRLDSGSVRHYWNMKGIIRVRGFDGQWKDYEASSEWDLRDGSEFVTRLLNAAERNPKRGNKTPREWITKQLDASRYHGYRNCEARAINAAIREFGLRQKYTQQELKKPFVCFNMVAAPDEHDPEQRRMALASALGSTELLFPHAGPALPAGSDPFAEPDQPPPANVNHATGEIIEGETADEDFAPAKAAEPEQPSVVVVTVKRRQDRQPYLTTTASTEPVLFEDTAQLGANLIEAMQKKTPVHLETEMKGKDRWLVQFTVADSEKL